jgi:hypothetical protein
MRAARQSFSLERATQRLISALCLLGALHGASAFGDVMLELAGAIEAFELRTGREFEVLLANKRREVERR